MVWSGVVGFLLGSLTVTLLQAWLPAGAMDSWGWRIPFPRSPGRLVWWVSTFGSGLDDTPEFKILNEADKVAESPLREAIRRRGRRSCG